MAFTGSVTVFKLYMVLFLVVWEVHAQYAVGALAAQVGYSENELVPQVGANNGAVTNNRNTEDKRVLYIRFPVRPIIKLKSKEKIPPPKSIPTEPTKALLMDDTDASSSEEVYEPSRYMAGGIDDYPDEENDYSDDDYSEEYSYFLDYLDRWMKKKRYDRNYPFANRYPYQWSQKSRSSRINPYQSKKRQTEDTSCSCETSDEELLYRQPGKGKSCPCKKMNGGPEMVTTKATNE